MRKRNKRKQKIIANKRKRVLMQCASVVNRDAVRREIIDGVEHIVISSFTMPDNIVMNGILYPADEISNSFGTLERTLAPIEHPTDSNGDFLSAFDPAAISNFYAGAYNANVVQIDGRVHIDKFINVPEAKKTDRGKRLLDRINEVETSDSPRPVHTSVGVFLLIEDTESPQTEFNGVKTNAEFNAIAREMVFDHDAILLDSVGAAQPHQGVGMAVNGTEKCNVQTFVLSQDVSEIVTPVTPPEDELSHQEIRRLLGDAIQQPPFGGGWIEQVFTTTFIFETQEQLFSVGYKIADGKAHIVGIPLAVERDETFTPKSNNEGDNMKELLVLALNAAKINTEGFDDAQLLAAYNELQAKQAESSDDAGDNVADLADVVTNALKPVLDRMDGIEEKLNKRSDDELSSLAETVGKSDLYANLDAEAAKKLGVETLRGMAANCLPSFGLQTNHSDDSSADYKTEMPD